MHAVDRGRHIYKMDTPNRQAIYLGESELVQYGKKVAFIDYDEKKAVWTISPTVHRHSKNVQVMNGNVILKTKVHTEATALDLEIHLDKVNGKEAPVYEVEKIHDKRLVGGEVEYRCRWKGYAKSHKTWEPKAILTEYGLGAIDMVIAYEVSQGLRHGRKYGVVRYVNMNKQERAVTHLMGKPNRTAPEDIQCRSWSAKRLPSKDICA